jgi:hypothetical protein
VCPINHLFFSEEPLRLDASYGTLLLGENFRLYYSNSQKEFPLVTTDFQMGFQKEVCIDTDQVILPFYHFRFWQKELFYASDGCPTKISSELSYLDRRYVFLASQPFKNLLYSNGLKEYSTTNRLDLFDYFEEQNEEFEVDVMFRPRVFFNSQCLVPDGTPATSLFTLSEGSDSGLTLSAITGSFLIILISAILGFSGIIFKNFCSRKRTRRKMMMVVLSVFMGLFALSLIPVITLLHRVNKVDHSFFKEKLDNGVVCGDRYVHAIVEGVVNGYDKTRAITVALIFFIILACGSWIVFVVIKVISNEEEYQTRTQSSRENSMKTVYIMGTTTENERYTNDREGSTKENALILKPEDEETWEDNRIASYIPQKIFIDDDMMKSMDSEMKGRPVVKSRVLGASKIIGKSQDELAGNEEYYRRKQKRKKRNEKLQKRLNKQKGFELINTNNSKNKETLKGGSSDEEEPSQIMKEFPRNYQTITIMSPIESMDESEIIVKKVHNRQISPPRKSQKDLKISIEKQEMPELDQDKLKSPINGKSKPQFQESIINQKEKDSKLDFEQKQKELGLNKPMGLFKQNNKPKRSVARNRNARTPHKNSNQRDSQPVERTSRKSRNTNNSEPKERISRKSRNTEKDNPKPSEPQSRPRTSKKSSMIGLSIMSKKVNQPKETSFDVSQEPQDFRVISRSGSKPTSKSPSILSGSKMSEVNAKPLRKSRKSRKDRSVYSSRNSEQEQGLIFGNKAFGKKPRERRAPGDGKVSRKSRRTKKEGSLLSQISRN